ncbi:hypothetical protein [Magnetospirillum fulvum]|uniref:Uncharacterized protein n=1 Tax=Magnetospirillum fulvum MGU-K5 TaxID=1316936 RepID=S9SD34_MAGFU|nr:hypothetical protein [Magnetospirillum fulvum]EPY02649.1 hypothetical protein K678_04874 [Magnetospirillum fulvum MGU-K5]
MAYLSKDLSVLAYANGFTLWHYTTPDLASVVDTTGYFNPAAQMLRVGDIVIANVDTAGSMKAGLFLVSANANGIVDVNDLTQIGSADSR